MRNVQSIAPQNKDIAADYQTVTCWTRFSMIFTGTLILLLCACQYFIHNVYVDDTNNVEKLFVYECQAKEEDAHFMAPWCGKGYQSLQQGGNLRRVVNPFYWVVGVSSM